MVYRFKATLRSNKQFQREYEIRPSSTLYEFHNFLVMDLAFAPDQLVMFRASDRNGAVRSQYGLFDMGDGTIDNITLQDCEQKGEVIFEYVYDIFNRRSIILELVSHQEESAKFEYPRLVSEKGTKPDQFSSEHDRDDEYHASGNASVDEDELEDASDEDDFFDEDEDADED